MAKRIKIILSFPETFFFERGRVYFEHALVM